MMIERWDGRNELDRIVVHGSAAERRARTTAAAHVGAVAFARTGDPGTGEVQEATVLGQYGEVDLDALSV